MPTDLLSYGKGAMIRARDLRKSYANVQAVDGVSLEFIDRPSLESVFLNLTGRRLRD